MTMKKLIILTALLLTILYMFTLTACSQRASAEEIVLPPPEQILTFSVTSLPTIDPQRASSDSSYIVIKGFAEGLISLSNGEIYPGVAVSWSYSADNWTWTFNLRRDASWSDGVPLTAHDFMFAFYRLFDPENEFENRPFLNKILHGYEVINGELPVEALGVSAPDAYTFVIRLNTPAPYFIYALDKPIFYPARRDFVERFGELFATAEDKIIGNGPFIIEEYLSDRRIRLIPNENYWNREDITLEEVTILVLDADSALSAFRRGELDMINIPLSQTSEFLSGESRFMTSPVKPFKTGGIEWLNINTTSEENIILTSRYFRRALNFALDREALVYEATDSVHLPLMRAVHPNLTGFYEGYPIDVLTIEPDIERARAYLVAAMDETLIANAVDVYISIRIPDNQAARRIAEYLKNEWERILGINVDVLSLSSNALLVAMQNRDFDLILEAVYPDFNDPYAFLGRFTGQFDNPRFDMLILNANAAAQQFVRFALFSEAEYILLDESAVIPLLTRQRAWAMRPTLRNFDRFYYGARSDFRFSFFE